MTRVGVKVSSQPGALLQELAKSAYRLKRIGLEAEPLSQWLYSAIAEEGLPVICVETRHMRAVSMINGLILLRQHDRDHALGHGRVRRVG
jgi:hypothetical protein